MLQFSPLSFLFLLRFCSFKFFKKFHFFVPTSKSLVSSLTVASLELYVTFDDFFLWYLSCFKFDCDEFEATGYSWRVIFYQLEPSANVIKSNVIKSGPKVVMKTKIENLWKNTFMSDLTSFADYSNWVEKKTH